MLCPEFKTVNSKEMHCSYGNMEIVSLIIIYYHQVPGGGNFLFKIDHFLEKLLLVLIKLFFDGNFTVYQILIIHTLSQEFIYIHK